MTSLTRELGSRAGRGRVRDRARRRLGEVYEREPVEARLEEVLGQLTLETV